MSPEMPSRIILWCLCRFVSDDALIGDLVQERGSGRSPVWFARESDAAIVLSMIGIVQNRKLLSLRTMVVGYALLYGGLSVWRHLARFVEDGCWPIYRRTLSDRPASA